MKEKEINNKNFDWSEKYPIVRITFYDHCYLETREIGQIEKNSKPYIIQEFGYLIIDEKDYIVISNSVSFSGERGMWDFGSGTVILKSALVKPLEFLQKKNPLSPHKL